MDIYNEFKSLIEAGYKDITLLGQNVNSYGKNLEEKIDFADLLQLLCTVPGEYVIHFMSSHPKDISKKLIDMCFGSLQKFISASNSAKQEI